MAYVYKPIGFLSAHRIVAAVTEAILLFLILIAVISIAFSIERPLFDVPSPPLTAQQTRQLNELSFGFFALLATLVLCEALTGLTVSKVVWGLRVRREDLSPATRSQFVTRAILRNSPIFCIILSPWLINHVAIDENVRSHLQAAVPLAWIAVLATLSLTAGRPLHDKLAKTVVVRRVSEIAPPNGFEVIVLPAIHKE